MSILSAIIYGIIQGAAEFLPISSSAHLALAQSFFGSDSLSTDYFTFDILLHLSTLSAVIICYYKEILPLFPAFFTLIKKLFRGKLRFKELTSDEKLIALLFVSSLPLLAVPLFDSRIEALTKSAKAVGILLIINGLILLLSGYIKKGGKNINEATPKNALTVGLFQLCAVFPGLSRSGSTITGGRLCGFECEFAVRFSFLMSIPAVLSANVFKLPELVSTPVPSALIPAFAVGMSVAAVTGILSIKLIKYISKKSSFKLFSFYTILLGIIAIIFG